MKLLKKGFVKLIRNIEFWAAEQVSNLQRYFVLQLDFRFCFINFFQFPAFTMRKFGRSSNYQP